MIIIVYYILILYMVFTWDIEEETSKQKLQTPSQKDVYEMRIKKNKQYSMILKILSFVGIIIELWSYLLFFIPRLPDKPWIYVISQVLQLIITIYTYTIINSNVYLLTIKNYIWVGIIVLHTFFTMIFVVYKLMYPLKKTSKTEIKPPSVEESRLQPLEIKQPSVEESIKPSSVEESRLQLPEIKQPSGQEPNLVLFLETMDRLL